MRTTLTLDDDVLAAARELAEREGKTMGQVLSELARRALRPSTPAGGMRNGIPQFPVRADGVPVTLELANRLRDEEA